MKFKIFFTMLAVALFTVSCSSDDDNDGDGSSKTTPSQEIAGTYSGYTSAAFTYSSTPIVTNDETLTLTSNSDGTANMTFVSNQWGTTTASSMTVLSTTSGYAFSGTGTSVMSSHSGTSSEYEATISGTISSDKSDVEMTITLTIMGGTTITFKLGDAPADEYLQGSYSGYSSAAFTYSSTPIVTNDETLALTSNGDGTASMTFTSNTWGTTTVSSMTISSTTSGDYTFEGEGTAAMSSHTGTTSEYEATISGTVSADKSEVELTITLSIMGGTTITFKLGDAPAVEFLPGTYSGYTVAAFAYGSMTTEDETMTITANDDNSLTLVYESSTWGTTTVNNISVEIDDDGNYVLSGEGTSVMGMEGSSTGEYACTLSGTVSSDKETAEFVITLTIMGGTTITFNLGDAPATE